MTDASSTVGDSLGRRARKAVMSRFSLREDKADDAVIDQSLRAGVEMQGTNLWVLMFAIFIASIGLNVNSTAVIIGAMLISPLMGPIMGIGYGVGISDITLIRASLKNLGIATMLALLTSTAYFALSPLTAVQSELLARTTPTIWDVLIALFGGLAGIVATTRKEKSNAIPGVAIATALMPPLCTAGFGIATGNVEFFVGAFYLFTINSVFIALASAITVRAFHVPQKRFVNEFAARRVHLILGSVVLITVLPSLYLAYQLVGEEVFKSRAARFVHSNLESEQSHVVATKFDASAKRIEVTLIGDAVVPSRLNEIASRMPGAGLAGAELKVFQTGAQKLDVAALKSNLLGDLYKAGQVELAQKDQAIEKLQSELNSVKASQALFGEVPAELSTLYPQIDAVALAKVPEWRTGTGWGPATVVAILRASKPLSKRDQLQLERWLAVRLKFESVRVRIETSSK